MNDREFWVQVRRGLLTVVAAIDDRQPEPQPFWTDMRKGFAQITRSIEYRWNLPIHSRVPIGAAGPIIYTDEPPAVPLARSSTGGIG